MTFYSQLAAVASRLLTDKGQSVSFSRRTGGTFNPATGTYSGDTATTFSGYGAAFNYNKTEIDGTIVQSGDLRLILEAVATPPAQGDEATVGGIDYRVMDVRPTSPGGTVTHYELQLRK